ncbi:MAG: hypothetical protein ACJ736_02240 [Streptomyces sp.]
MPTRIRTAPAAFFVLTALADQPRHGYGILREVEELSEANRARPNADGGRALFGRSFWRAGSRIGHE